MKKRVVSSRWLQAAARKFPTDRDVAKEGGGERAAGGHLAPEVWTADFWELGDGTITRQTARTACSCGLGREYVTSGWTCKKIMMARSRSSVVERLVRNAEVK